MVNFIHFCEEEDNDFIDHFYEGYESDSGEFDSDTSSYENEDEQQFNLLYEDPESSYDKFQKQNKNKIIKIKPFQLAAEHCSCKTCKGINSLYDDCILQYNTLSEMTNHYHDLYKNKGKEHTLEIEKQISILREQHEEILSSENLIEINKEKQQKENEPKKIIKKQKSKNPHNLFARSGRRRFVKETKPEVIKERRLLRRKNKKIQNKKEESERKNKFDTEGYQADKKLVIAKFDIDYDETYKENEVVPTVEPEKEIKTENEVVPTVEPEKEIKTENEVDDYKIIGKDNEDNIYITDNFYNLSHPPIGKYKKNYKLLDEYLKNTNDFEDNDYFICPWYKNFKNPNFELCVGGKIKFNELNNEGVMREVQEEVGIKTDKNNLKFIKNETIRKTTKSIYKLNIQNFETSTFETDNTCMDNIYNRIYCIVYGKKKDILKYIKNISFKTNKEIDGVIAIPYKKLREFYDNENTNQSNNDNKNIIKIPKSHLDDTLEIVQKVGLEDIVIQTY